MPILPNCIDISTAAPYPTRAGKRTSRAHTHICPYIAVDGYTAEFRIFRFPYIAVAPDTALFSPTLCSRPCYLLQSHLPPRQSHNPTGLNGRFVHFILPFNAKIVVLPKFYYKTFCQFGKSPYLCTRTTNNRENYDRRRNQTD